MSRNTIPPSDVLTQATGRAAGTLSHPLPAGMRDLLPAEAEAQGRLSSSVLSTFRLHGYQQVTLPAFEYAEVLERGLGNVDPNSLLRFVEPETGEVVALRPDMTPQVARLVSTRLQGTPLPVRLSYRGSVLRRQHQRARNDQQFLQTGIELVGRGGVEADLEVISVCIDAVTRAGLRNFVLDLGHGGVAQSLLAGVDPSAAELLLESLSLKDGSELSRRAQSVGVSSELQRKLVSLIGLSGGVEVFERARHLLGTTPAWQQIEELEELHRLLSAGLDASRIVVDLGEVRAAAYYTGPTFQILAEGPGQAVASGGRYDSLYGQFGPGQPAAGAGVQVDHLRWALGHGDGPRPVRAVVVDGEAGRALVASLRQANVAAVLSDEKHALDYARAWRYSHLLRASVEGVRAIRLTEGDGPDEELGSLSVAEITNQLGAH